MRHTSFLLGTVAFMARTAGLAGLLASAAHAADSTVLASIERPAADFCKTRITTISGSKVLDGAYTGQCRAGVPQGEGTVVFANGDRYQGNFTAGKIEGRGTWTSAKGGVYSGQWRDGKRHGAGKLQWGQGSSYAGDWFYDRRHGMGTLTYPSGDRFEGEFRNNKYYAGTFYTASGEKRVCNDGQCR